MNSPRLELINPHSINISEQQEEFDAPRVLLTDDEHLNVTTPTPVIDSRLQHAPSKEESKDPALSPLQSLNDKVISQSMAFLRTSLGKLMQNVKEAEKELQDYPDKELKHMEDLQKESVQGLAIMKQSISKLEKEDKKVMDDLTSLRKEEIR